MALASGGMQNGVPYHFEYADAAARTGDTSVTSADLGKWARQLDDDSLWMLTAPTPTWIAVGTGGTVSSVTGTAPIASSGGSTPAISIAAATTGALGAVQLATPSSDVTAGHVVQANDARLSDARTPTGHHTTHATAGTDAIAPADIGAAAASHTHTEADLSLADVTTDNVSTTQHGFAPKAPNDATQYLDGTGAYSVPAGGFANPMTTAGDLILGGSAGAATRLGKGSDSQVLTVDPATHLPVWAAATGGFSNPMTTQDDLIVGGASGAAARLGKGSDGQVLTVDPTTHHLVWANPSSGFADPTTTKGDLIVHGASTTRLPVGSDGLVLTADSTQAAGVAWAAGVSGGNTIFTNAAASPPASPINGDSWYPSDGVGVYFLRVSGAWVARYAGMPTSDPTAQTWAWVNQGSATASDRAGAVHLAAPSNSNAIGMRIRKKAVPTAPYTATALLLLNSSVANTNHAGVLLRESSSGKLVILGITAAGSGGIISQKYNSPGPSSYVGDYSTASYLAPRLIWLRLKDDNTNRSFWYSLTGHDSDFQQLGSSVSRTDFCTPDEIGWYLDPQNAVAGVTLLSWAEA